MNQLQLTTELKEWFNTFFIPIKIDAELPLYSTN